MRYTAVLVNRKFWAWLFGLAVVILLAVNVTLWLGPKSVNATSAATFVQNPVVLAVIGAILTFLVLERWKKLENDISEIGKSQSQTLSQIREDAKSLTLQQIEAATLTAQSIESRIGRLVDEYPWIADITENEFYPDASGCRIVLRTAEQLTSQGRTSLAYEYLFFWAKADGTKGQLEGTAEDFNELATFCAAALGDEYLAFLILRVGYRRAVDRLTLLPDFLRVSIRRGSADEARWSARELRSVVEPSWRKRFAAALRNEPRPLHATFGVRALLALAVYEAVTGDFDKAAVMIEKAAESARRTRRMREVSRAKAEIAVIAGDYKAAEAELADIKYDDCSDDELLELLGILRSVGDVKRARLVVSAITSRHLGPDSERAFAGERGSDIAISASASAADRNAPVTQQTGKNAKVRIAREGPNMRGPNGRRER